MITALVFYFICIILVVMHLIKYTLKNGECRVSDSIIALILIIFAPITLIVIISDIISEHGDAVIWKKTSNK